MDPVMTGETGLGIVSGLLAGRDIGLGGGLGGVEGGLGDGGLGGVEGGLGGGRLGDGKMVDLKRVKNYQYGFGDVPWTSCPILSFC